MLTRAQIEFKLKYLRPLFAEKYHESRIGDFVSYTNNNQHARSDLDLLVEFSEPIGWKFFIFESFLEQSFGVPIDLVTVYSLKERMKESILIQVNYV